ncbi:MAG: hypothetical protein A3B70_03385 [Deltaproteobacteria bacterium RIFCSPHIGHO2_02_FULL_40_11]|nr:MAG: hypothetical protein A3B70_03385 [Deltaproteobacteria bacterium RIFCSPHIGHO2_02_FULL_40_11]
MFTFQVHKIYNHPQYLGRQNDQKSYYVIHSIGKEPKMADIGYCVKCKEKREMKDSKQVTMKNGRKALQGKCSVCGTGMYKILPKS